MVKGISKRVVVVRFPDTRVFEQAIFIVRGGYDEGGKAVSASQIVDEACLVAESYVKRGRKPRKHVPPLAFTAVGALCVGLAWIITFIVR
jgi:hypothetical protein